MHRQLTFQDRIYLEVMKWERMSQGAIAKRLRVHVSTVRRELLRGNTSKFYPFAWGYRADLAEAKTRKNLKRRGRKPKLVGALEVFVRAKLQEGWSPEQISGRLRYEGAPRVSHESIYQYIKRDKRAGGVLYLSLRHGRRRRKKRFAVPRVRADILFRKNIRERPKVISERKREGDWERDLVFGDSRKSALLTFIERKTLYALLVKVESKSPKEIADRTIEALKKYRPKSLTNDNGFEFREHQRESKLLNIPIYFTNPYSSWEKGTCENMNGLIRQYFPKRSVTRNLTDAKIKEIQQLLNSRPRKKLGFLTPNEAFSLSKEAIKI